MDATQMVRAKEMLRHFLSQISQHLDDPLIQEIMINSPTDVWIERSGQMLQTNITLTPEQVRGAIVLLGNIERKNVQENTKNAIIDTRMDGVRIAAALAPTALRGHSICIRKHSARNFSLEEYEEQVQSFKKDHQVKTDPEPPRPKPDGSGMAEWLKWMTRARKSTAVSGGTSTGKTSMLNALLKHIPEDERVLTLEDVAELKPVVPNQVQLETNAQVDILMRDLVKLALRYRPDRIIVGELRGSEAFDFLQAINTGHDGGFCSIHANSAALALHRLETLVLQANLGWPLIAIKSQIASTIDYVIQMGRTKGQRHIAEIIRIDGINDDGYVTETIFNFSEEAYRKNKQSQLPSTNQKIDQAEKPEIVQSEIME